MKILISTSDVRMWQGLVQIEEEVYRVTLWPGSATEEWKALLQPAAWVELSEGKVKKAIEEAKGVYDRGESVIEKVDIVDLLEIVRGDEKLRKKIEEVMKGEE